MTNDLKLGAVDVADLRLGGQPVAKVMRGTTLVWQPGAAPAPPPSLIDSFVGSAVGNSTSRGYLVPAGKTIPAGSLLACGTIINGVMSSPLSMFDNSSQAGAANAYVRRSTDAWVQGTNVSGFIYLCKVTRTLIANDQISFTYGVTRNRGVLVAAWFTGSRFADTTIDGDPVFNSGSSPNWATGAQVDGADNPTLDLALPIGTGGTPPYGFGSGFTKIGEGTTAAGSADRGCALGYRISPAPGARSAAGTCTDAVWGAGLVAVDYT